MRELKQIAQKISDMLKDDASVKAFYYVQEKEKQEFNLENGEFSLYRTLFDKSLNITVYKDHKKGMSATNRLDDASVEAAVKDALLSADSAVPDEAFDIAPKQENEDFEVGVTLPDMDKLFERTRELRDAIASQYPKIQVMLMIIEHEKVHRVYANTNGTQFETVGGKYNIEAEISGNDDGKTTSISGFHFSTDKLDKPFIENAYVRDQLEAAQAQLNSVECGDKFEGTVIFTPECLSSMMMSVISNFVSESVILDKTSIWLDKIGKQVADERITLKLDPMDERIVDFERHTSDGFKSEPYYLIKNGRLESFATSLYVSNKAGVERAKCDGMVEIMEPGDTSCDDIVKSVKRGIIVGGFSGGHPGTNGDFSGVAKNSFLIEDGKVKGAVYETMINGNLADMLNRVVAVSKETVEFGDAVLPYLAVDGIVISGKN